MLPGPQGECNKQIVEEEQQDQGFTAVVPMFEGAQHMPGHLSQAKCGW